MPKAQPAAQSCALADGVIALPQSLLWLERSGVLVAADAHFAYEDVIGGALPLWSTQRSTEILVAAARRMQAREIVVLGDVIHGSRMSDGAARIVSTSLDVLRAVCAVTLVAGNHEGASRGAAVLGETFEALERDGWALVHGDRPSVAPRTIVGHLHPSLPLGSGESMPVFLGSEALVVVPALTPYSSGLNVLSSECTDALHAFVPSIAGITVVASGDDRVYPFGSLQSLHGIGKPKRAQSLERSVRHRYGR